MSFAIDKALKTAENAGLQILQQGVLSQFTFQAPQDPEKKTRIQFRSLINMQGNKFPNVELYIDPQSIQVQKQVIQQKRLTKGGYVVQFWGHDLTNINVQTTTGNFQPLYGVQFQLPSNLTKKAAESWFNQVKERWMKGGGPLKVFEKIKTWVYQNRFDPSNPSRGVPLIELAYEDFIYNGYFTKFNYSLNAQSPFKIDFNFDFVAMNRRDSSMADIFGALTLADLVGDPVGTLTNTVKSATSAVISKGQKELAKLTDQVMGEGNPLADLIDDLPDKITLW